MAIAEKDETRAGARERERYVLLIVYLVCTTFPGHFRGTKGSVLFCCSAGFRAPGVSKVTREGKRRTQTAD